MAKSFNLLKIFLLLLWPATLAAQSIDFSGHAKALQYLQLDQRQPPRGLNLERLRLESNAAASIFSAHATLDHEFFGGALWNAVQSQALESTEKREFLELGWTHAQDANAAFRQKFYRLWAQAKWRELNLSFGRERLAWGQGRVFNPVDVVNPFAATTIERDERAVSDLARLAWDWGNLSSVEAVYVPRRAARWDNSLFLGRVKTNAREIDVAFSGGKAAGENMLGAELAGQAAGGSLRSEAAWFLGSEQRRSFARAVISYDYQFSFAKPLYFLTEYFYNGLGEKIFSPLLAAQTLPQDPPFVGRHYGAVGLDWDAHPLCKLSLYAVVNVENPSALVEPKVTWTPFTDCELQAGAQIFPGSLASEFGPRSLLAFTTAKIYF